jgi:hypothetical protein
MTEQQMLELAKKMVNCIQTVTELKKIDAEEKKIRKEEIMSIEAEIKKMAQCLKEGEIYKSQMEMFGDGTLRS